MKSVGGFRLLHQTLAWLRPVGAALFGLSLPRLLGQLLLALRLAARARAAVSHSASRLLVASAARLQAAAVHLAARLLAARGRSVWNYRRAELIKFGWAQINQVALVIPGPFLVISDVPLGEFKMGFVLNIPERSTSHWAWTTILARSALPKRGA